MFGKSQTEIVEDHRDSTMPRRAVAASAAPEVSSISSGLSIVGKIVGHGALTIFGHVEGELRASTVVIAEGAQMEGDVVAEELTIGGYVKGTIHANRYEFAKLRENESKYLVYSRRLLIGAIIAGLFATFNDIVKLASSP